VILQPFKYTANKYRSLYGMLQSAFIITLTSSVVHHMIEKKWKKSKYTHIFNTKNYWHQLFWDSENW